MTLLEFKPLKMRHSKNPGNTIMVEAKLGQMKITENIREAKEWIDDQDLDDDGNPIPAKFPTKS